MEIDFFENFLKEFRASNAQSRLADESTWLENVRQQLLSSPPLPCGVHWAEEIDKWSENYLFYFVYGDYRKKIFIILSGKGYRCLYEHFNDKQR